MGLCHWGEVMKRLTLIRHAKSSWANPGLSDFDRELNERGRRAAPEMGRRLKARGFAPDTLVSSPAKRALTTARIIAGELGFDEGLIDTDERIYEASVEDLAKVTMDLDDDLEHVVLVGHNPGFTSFANWLANCMIDNIPTCGVVDMDFEVASWAKLEEDSGCMLDFDYPKKR